jgi:hypothetical protein
MGMRISYTPMRFIFSDEADVIAVAAKTDLQD